MIRKVLQAAVWISIGTAPAALAADVEYFGSSGLFKVPSAAILGEGDVALQANAHNPAPGSLLNPETYTIALGAWRGLEVVGRLFGAHQRTGVRNRDLSIDLKYGQEFLDGALRVAAGVRDPNGEAQKFRARYLVMTGDWLGLEPTLGFGGGPDTLDGMFGGLAWRLLPGLRLVVDHDSESASAGVKMDSRDWLGPSVRVTASASWSERSDGVEGGLTVTMPIGRRVAPLEQRRTPARAAPPPIETAADPISPVSDEVLRRFAASLADAGFEAIRAGTRADGSVIVLFENRVYNHSMLDAYGVALARVAAEPGLEHTELDLVLTRQWVPMLAVRVGAADWHQFLEDGHGGGGLTPGAVRHAENVNLETGVTWLKTVAPMTAGELVVQPLARTFVATESGMLDVGLAAQVRFTQPLARGLSVTLGAQLPIAETDDFKSGENFQDFAPEAGLDQALIQLLHRPGPGLSWLWSMGAIKIFQIDAPMVALEQHWMSPGGTHQLHAKLMALHSSFDSHEVALATYTWFAPRPQVALSLTTGRFFMGDGGTRFTASRFFGDTEVGVFFKYESRTEQAGGFLFTLPLTPRRDMTPHTIQVRGPSRWGHTLTTTLNGADQRNPLRPLFLYEPVLGVDLRRDHLDAGRSMPATLWTGGARLREAGQSLAGGGS